MKDYSREKLLTAGNFIVTIYFLIIFLLYHFNYSNAVILFLHELLSISFLMIALIFFVFGIIRLIRFTTQPIFKLSFALLSITIATIIYSFIIS